MMVLFYNNFITYVSIFKVCNVIKMSYTYSFVTEASALCRLGGGGGGCICCVSISCSYIQLKLNMGSAMR